MVEGEGHNMDNYQELYDNLRISWFCESYKD